MKNIAIALSILTLNVGTTSSAFTMDIPNEKKLENFYLPQINKDDLISMKECYWNSVQDTASQIAEHIEITPLELIDYNNTLQEMNDVEFYILNNLETINDNIQKFNSNKGYIFIISRELQELKEQHVDKSIVALKLMEYIEKLDDKYNCGLQILKNNGNKSFILLTLYHAIHRQLKEEKN